MKVQIIRHYIDVESFVSLEDGKYFKVIHTENGWHCSCSQGMFKQDICDHIKAVKDVLYNTAHT